MRLCQDIYAKYHLPTYADSLHHVLLPDAGCRRERQRARVFSQTPTHTPHSAAWRSGPRQGSSVSNVVLCVRTASCLGWEPGYLGTNNAAQGAKEVPSWTHVVPRSHKSRSGVQGSPALTPVPEGATIPPEIAGMGAGQSSSVRLLRHVGAQHRPTLFAFS